MCESRNPSAQTITGSSAVSAIRYAQRMLSSTSCAEEQYSWIQPVSRWLMLSVRSGSRLQGAKTARLMLTMTSGTRSRDARCSCSCAYSSPCDDVAVNVRTPVRAAAIA